MVEEDLELFLEEFGKLLNKYHYASVDFTLSKFKDSKNFVIGFSYDGGTFHSDMAEIGKRDENEK